MLKLEYQHTPELFERIYRFAYTVSHIPFRSASRREHWLARRSRKYHIRKTQEFYEATDAYISKLNSVKLHLGCGDVIMKGWINIDQRDDVSAIDIKHDLRHPLPFRENTVDYIFNEHFLEHLDPKEGVCFLQECRRCLKPGGVLRIAMPHIRPVVERYYNDDINSDWVKAWGVQTKAELVNIGFKYWGHQWLYDEDELERRLKEAGFEKFIKKQNGESDHHALRSLESRIGSELIYEAIR